MISLWEGASVTFQLSTLEFIRSSGDKFSIIIPLKWDVNIHRLTWRLEEKVTNPNPPFPLSFNCLSSLIVSAV